MQAEDLISSLFWIMAKVLLGFCTAQIDGNPMRFGPIDQWKGQKCPLAGILLELSDGWNG